MLSNDVVAALDALGAAVSTLADVDLEALTADELIGLAERCEHLHRRQIVLRDDISRELHRRDVAELGGAPHKVLADWLRITPAEARRRADRAEPLSPRSTLTGEPLPPSQPATAEAWRAGLLDVEHVRVIQRFLAELPVDVATEDRTVAEAFLAEHARNLRPDQLLRLAERLALMLNPDGTFTDQDRANRRGFTWGRQRADGMSEGRLCASPQLRAELDAWFAKYGAPGMCNPADPCPMVDGEPTQAQPDADRRTHGQRRHDALSALVRGQLGDPKLGRHNGLPVTVIVSATLQDLQNKSGYASTAGGTLLPMADFIRLASHAYHYLALFDDRDGRALWLGRSKRVASADQRIVLHARDSGCTFPGCTVPGYGTEVHHATADWADGGATDIDDLTLACGPHNRLVKKGGWSTRKRPDGSTEWIPPPQRPLIGGVNRYHRPETLLKKLRH